MTIEELLNLISHEDRKKLLIINGDCIGYFIKSIRGITENAVYVDIDEINNYNEIKEEI
jgi:hypothetical protein|nr:MAG TPA: hypothetical protein [Caudoviricetes sp.]